MPPQIINRALSYCPHCGNDSHKLVLAQDSQWSSQPVSTSFYFCKCETCGGTLLYQSDPERVRAEGRAMARSGFGLREFRLSDKILLWPRAGVLHRSVPDRIRTIYEEASMIKRRGPNAFANQIRRALEALCHDRATTGGNLFQSLRQLSTNGEIPAVLADMTDVLRLFGNMGSHDGDVQVGTEHVDIIDEFFRAVVEYVYVAPNRVADVRAHLDALRNPTPSAPLGP